MNVYIPTTATVVQINQYGTGTSIQTGTGTSIQNGTGTSIQNGIGTVQHSSVQLSPSHLRAGITSIITVHQQAGTHLTISFGANGPKITSQSCPESTAYDPYRSELAMTTHYTHGYGRLPQHTMSVNTQPQQESTYGTTTTSRMVLPMYQYSTRQT